MEGKVITPMPCTGGATLPLCQSFLLLGEVKSDELSGECGREEIGSVLVEARLISRDIKPREQLAQGQCQAVWRKQAGHPFQTGYPRQCHLQYGQ